MFYPKEQAYTFFFFIAALLKPDFLTLSDIRRIGICLIGHQRRIISSIQSLRLQLHHIQQNGFQV